MDITKITNYKPDTELHNDNPFQRTEIERAKKARREFEQDGPGKVFEYKYALVIAV